MSMITSSSDSSRLSLTLECQDLWTFIVFDTSVTVNNDMEEIIVGKETIVLPAIDVITSVWSTDKRRHYIL